MKWRALYSFLNADLQCIEAELELSTNAEHDLLRESMQHLLHAGGKRIRPVFVLLGGKFGEYNVEHLKHIAVALELIHMASLVHDDVNDRAHLRRGEPTINAKWSNQFAIYAGDYMLARSLEQMTELHNPLAHQLLAKAIVEVCKGEIEQVRDKYCYDQTLRQYLRRIKRKTALLIAVSCQLGAVIANAPKHVHEKLYWFGYYVGMSFQITDDILDFVGTEKELGKPAGGDLLQGNVTLPALLAMQDKQVHEKIRSINESTTPEEIKKVLIAIKNTDAIKQSYDLSNRYLQKAFHILEKLPASKARTAFYNVAKYIGKRKF